MHHANISFLLHLLDPENEEPELEVQAEQVQAEDTNPELEQDKPRCITPKSFTLFWMYIFMLRMIVH
jgi:hypothetical protein